MLKINDVEYELLTSEFKYINAINNKKKGFSGLVTINIKLNNIKGYISFYVDFFSNNDFKNIENKEYIELPTELDSKISIIEIFDTKNFIDFIDSNVTLKFGRIIDNKLKLKLIIDDNLIKLNYDGFLDMKN